MDKRNLNWIIWGFVAATVLIVALMLSATLHRTSRITLPGTEQTPGQAADGSAVSGDALTVIEVTPETVQAAIATLSRPATYRRTITVEQFWDGGSGTYETTVAVHGSWTRTDRTMPNGQVRHVVLGKERVYIWYNQEREIYSAAAGTFSADNEQTIPTYEEILELPVKSIVVADFRTVSDVDCIYVETTPDESGYVMCYWVSVDTGLLTVAEKLWDGEPVYRMAGLTVDSGGQEEAFVLPDGTSLL